MNELFLCEELFELNNIKKAIEAFEGIVNVVLKKQNGYYYCMFENNKYDLSLTIKEFENYIIDLHNSKGIL